MTEANSGETILLFAYGTLKRRERNHRYLAQQQYLGEVETLPGYFILDAGLFPCLIASPKGGTVQGEMYRVTVEAINNLDFHEGSPRFYKRGPIQIPGYADVQTYFYQRTTYLYGQLQGEWPRKTPWNWWQRLKIAIARNLQHT